MHKQGGHGSSKSGGTPRRGMVLRFLGGCEGNEMKEFIELLILPFRHLLDGMYMYTWMCVKHAICSVMHKSMSCMW